MFDARLSLTRKINPNQTPNNWFLFLCQHLHRHVVAIHCCTKLSMHESLRISELLTVSTNDVLNDWNFAYTQTYMVLLRACINFVFDFFIVHDLFTYEEISLWLVLVKDAKTCIILMHECAFIFDLNKLDLTLTLHNECVQDTLPMSLYIWPCIGLHISYAWHA